MHLTFNWPVLVNVKFLLPLTKCSVCIIRFFAFVDVLLFNEPDRRTARNKKTFIIITYPQNRTTFNLVVFLHLFISLSRAFHLAFAHLFMPDIVHAYSLFPCI